MAKSSITLPNGTVVKIEGSPEEIAQIIELYSQVDPMREKKTKSASSPKQGSAGKTKRKAGPQTRIGQLIADDFFKEKRGIQSVLDELARRGFIYKQEDIGTPLRRLVQTKKLRRLDEKGKWVYVNP